MAQKRIRDNEITPVSPIVGETIITPETKQEQKPNQYDTILEMLQENNKRVAQLEQENKELIKKVAEANGDISEQVKQSKRKYGFNLDGSRNLDEKFSFRYNCLINENKEKVVVKVETIGRPINILNTNTGKWFNQHNVKITFQDKTTAEIDILDYINQKFQYEDFVGDDEIKKVDGVKNYTFHTKKFGTFTIAENFIN